MDDELIKQLEDDIKRVGEQLANSTPGTKEWDAIEKTYDMLYSRWYDLCKLNSDNHNKAMERGEASERFETEMAVRECEGKENRFWRILGAVGKCATVALGFVEMKMLMEYKEEHYDENNLTAEVKRHQPWNWNYFRP